MKVGIIGVGVVGGALYKWLKNNTKHLVVRWDPDKDLKEDLRSCDAIFICIPVTPSLRGQDQKNLESCVEMARNYSEHIFIRSTVLPGTNDRLKTIACPEFLTARVADEEMDRLPILVGDADPEFMRRLFPSKPIYMMRNTEAELSKFSHNCFGATKVTFFNMIYKMCQDLEIDYENVREGFLMSGFINEPHTMVPGPDGQLGYGGACFPENMEAFYSYLRSKNYSPIISEYQDLMITLMNINQAHRRGNQ